MAFPSQGNTASVIEGISITQLSDVTAKSGSGTTVVFNDTPTVLTPTIASFANASHNHTNAAGGAQLTGAAISDVTGTGTTVVLSSSPTVVTPTIASFANATHNHTNAAGGAQLTGAAISDVTGSGTTVVLSTSPTITTPVIARVTGSTAGGGSATVRATSNASQGPIILEVGPGGSDEAGRVLSSKEFLWGRTTALDGAFATFEKNANSATLVSVSNTTSGTAGQAKFELNAATSVGDLYMTSAGFTAANGINANELGLLIGSGASSIGIITQGNTPIRFVTGSTPAERGRWMGNQPTLLIGQTTELNPGICTIAAQWSTNGSTGIQHYNATDGTAASAFMNVVGPGGSASIAVYAPSFTTSNLAIADSTVITASETSGGLVLRTTGAAIPIIFGVNNAEGLRVNTNNNLQLETAKITAGSGTGVTVDESSAVERVVYKVTVTFAALAAAATTADKTIATLPAKTRLVGIIADTTTTYAGGLVVAATLIVGKTVGGNEYIVSHDVFLAAVTKGLADADLGTSINRANAIQGGDLASWTATTNVSVRLTTTGANTNALTQGSTTYYLITEKHP